MKKLFSLVLFLTLLITISCSVDDSIEIAQIEESVSFVEMLSDDVLLTAKRPKPSIWADCRMYSGIVVPATFKSESNPFDEQYAVPDGDGNPMPIFKGGLPLISDSKPGGQDYNAGRWHLNVLKEGVDYTKYSEAFSEEDLDLDDFMSTDAYFGCPLTKFK